MDHYNEYLAKQFCDLEINLVKHNDSPTGMPCYINVLLCKTPKDKGTTAKDLSNYLYRMGLKFQTVPEYVGKGKQASLRFYCSWEDMQALLPNIWKAVAPERKPLSCLPGEFHSLIIQNHARDVYAPRL